VRRTGCADSELAYSHRRRYGAGQFYCFSAGALGPTSGAGGAAGSAEGVVPRSSDAAAQSPAQSFVPLTVPTGLQPIDSFGLTCTSGLLPALGGTPWAYALVEKQTAVSITSALIVISPSPLALCVIALIPGLSEQLFAHEISRFAALCRTAADRAEACERALAAAPPFLRALAISPLSFPRSPSTPHSFSRFARPGRGTSPGSSLSAKSVSGSGILYELNSRRAHFTA
jgi:hypothetical protein